MTTTRQIHLALSIQSAGYHYGAWRLDSSPSNPDTDIDYYIRLAKLAEQGKFDMVFFADWLAVRENVDDREAVSRVAGLARLEPLTALSVISAHTKNVGLVGTLSTTFNEPYNVARIMASLDHVSKGRAGWNVVASQSDKEAQNFGGEKILGHDQRYARAREFVEVVLGLWDSWEDDAFVRDKAAGVYFHPDKVHELNHKGANFSVRGPLNMERPPQGRPIISQAGMSPDGQELAASTADMIFAPSPSLSVSKAYYASVKGRMEKYGRHPDDLKIMPGVMPIIGRTQAEAQAKLEALGANVDEQLGRALLSFQFGDLRGLPIDEPIPNLPPLSGSGGVDEILKGMAASGQTIRELYQRAAARIWTPVVGTPDKVADHFEEWFTERAADGFCLLFAETPESTEDFVELVVPELQKRGLFRTEYTGSTLRDHLGLARPANRHVSRLAAE